MTGTNTPVTDDKTFTVIRHSGPHNTDIKALLQGFLFLPKKCITEKTKNEAIITINNLII